jgi:hypothetical protein
MQAMTKRQAKSGTIDVKALLREDEDFLRAVVRTALQEVLEAEMTGRADSGGHCQLVRSDQPITRPDSVH